MRNRSTTDARSVALVFAGGTLGCAAREALSLVFPAGDGFPSTIFAINLSGAFLLGLLLDGLGGNDPDIDARGGVRLFLGTGVLGGYTTYSALATDAAAMVGAGSLGLGLVYAAATVILGGLASWAGMAIAAQLRARKGRR